MDGEQQLLFGSLAFGAVPSGRLAVLGVAAGSLSAALVGMAVLSFAARRRLLIRGDDA